MKKQIVRIALLGATAGTMLVASALILPTVALGTDCAEGASAIQPAACQAQTTAADDKGSSAIRIK
jgi:hypothetical protein